MLKDNVLSQNPRGIWLYQTALRDVAVLGNAITEGGGIYLRAYSQRDPLVEYKKESFELFQAMKDRIEEEIVRYLWRLTPVLGDDNAAAPVPVRPPASR